MTPFSAWYDSHRNDIKLSGANAGGDYDFENVDTRASNTPSIRLADVLKSFDRRIYKNFDDAPGVSCASHR